MVATVDEATVFVPILKLAVVAPCGTVTDGGTVADALLLERVTTILAAAVTVSEDSATVELELKVALTDCAEFIVTLHAPVPLQAPPQPAKVEPESGVA